MNFEKKVAVSLHAIKEKVEQGRVEEAVKDLDRFWDVMCRLGRNNEAITVGAALHGTQVIEEAKTENRVILGSGLYFHDILLAK